MNDYIPKPIDTETLCSVLGKWLFNDDEEERMCLLPVCESPRDIVSATEKIGYPGLDIDPGLRRIRGNRIAYSKLMGHFHKDFSNVADQIRQAIKQGDQKLARQICHTLAGVAGNISATDLEDAARKLYDELKMGLSGRVDLFTDNLETALNQALESAKRFCENTVARTSPEDESASAKKIIKTSSVDLPKVLAELDGYIARNNIRAEKEFGMVKRILCDNVDIKTDLNKLEQEIGRFDFKAARTTLAGIIIKLGIPTEAV